MGQPRRLRKPHPHQGLEHARAMDASPGNKMRKRYQRFTAAFASAALLTFVAFVFPSATAQATRQNALRVASGRFGDRLTVAWRFPTGGPITGAAAVSADRVFFGSGDGNV